MLFGFQLSVDVTASVTKRQSPRMQLLVLRWKVQDRMRSTFLLGSASVPPFLNSASSNSVISLFKAMSHISHTVLVYYQSEAAI